MIITYGEWKKYESTVEAFIPSKYGDKYWWQILVDEPMQDIMHAMIVASKLGIAKRRKIEWKPVKNGSLSHVTGYDRDIELSTDKNTMYIGLSRIAYMITIGAEWDSPTFGGSIQSSNMNSQNIIRITGFPDRDSAKNCIELLLGRTNYDYIFSEVAE